MADERHPLCVLVAEQVATARALAEWLTDKGYPAEAVMPGPVATPGDSLGLTEEAFTGIEVRVAKPENVDPAKQLIAEQKDTLKEIQERHQKRAARTGTVTAECEDCGKPSEWPATEMGTVQTCPHCGRYMDVPDPDENWDGVDFSEEEAAAEDGPPDQGS
jgi:hypothetical protein